MDMCEDGVVLCLRVCEKIVCLQGRSQGELRWRKEPCRLRTYIITVKCIRDWVFAPMEYDIETGLPDKHAFADLQMRKET